MKLYFAPLEGITGYIYRNAHMELFGGCDKYFAPFITPVENERLSIKCFRDIIPENNSVPLEVQVLTNSAEAFFRFENEIRVMGYENVNLNLGCPSGTVVKKNRGAGFLRDKEMLRDFFEEIFASTSLSVSVKSRCGFLGSDEFPELLDIYNAFPVSLLTLHPRTRTDYYKGEIRMETFDIAYSKSTVSLCYNGDINSTDGYFDICNRYPDIEGIMIGRGAIANPAIFREIHGGNKITTEELIAFTEVLAERYYKVLGCDVYTLHKLKEIWIYMMNNYPEEKKILKSVKKSQSVRELINSIKVLPPVVK